MSIKKNQMLHVIILIKKGVLRKEKGKKSFPSPKS